MISSKSLKTNGLLEKKQRNCGIDMLKVIGILLVVLSHVVQTLTTEWGNNIDTSGFFIDITHSTTNVETILILLLRHSGTLGNMIFFTCSAWYLVESKSTNVKKIIRMLADIWVISLSWLIVMLAIYGESLGIKDILKSLFPTYFGNNWYLTTYIVFCFIYPFINPFLSGLTQKQHFSFAVLAFIIFVAVGMVRPFHINDALFTWIAVYIVVAYLKKYNSNIIESKKINTFLLLFGIIGFIGCVLLWNFLGQKFALLSTKMLNFNSHYNVFFWIISFSSLCLFRSIKFKSKFIGFLATQSLLVYVIHENILFRAIVRPKIWNWININLNQNLIILQIFIFTIALFVASCLISILYTLTLQKLVRKIADKVYVLLCKIRDKVYSLITKKQS